MHRISIIGTTGSGKSTLAKSLSARLGLPHTELDSLYWLPEWRERDKSEFRQLVDQATSMPKWVIDGGYSEVRDFVRARGHADLARSIAAAYGDATDSPHLPKKCASTSLLQR